MATPVVGSRYLPIHERKFGNVDFKVRLSFTLTDLKVVNL